jgi:hypothetical protein
MKKFYMTLVAMLCGVAAFAQNTLTAEPIKVETGTKSVDLVLGLTNADPISAFAFRIAFPTGIKAKAAKYWALNEERIDMDWVREFSDDEEAAPFDAAYGLTIQDASDGNKQYAVYCNKGTQAFLGNEGDILTIPLTLTDVADGQYEIKFYEISISTTGGVSVADAKEIVATLTVGKVVGINSINADDVNAPIYNVAGQRVSKAQKGIFIQNGKKIIVK